MAEDHSLVFDVFLANLTRLCGLRDILNIVDILDKMKWILFITGTLDQQSKRRVYTSFYQHVYSLVYERAQCISFYGNSK